MDINLPEFKESNIISEVPSGANFPPWLRKQKNIKSLRLKNIWSYKRKGEIKPSKHTLQELALFHAVTGSIVYTSANQIYCDLDGPAEGIAIIHEVIRKFAGDRFMKYEEYEQSSAPSTFKIVYVETPEDEISVLNLFKNPLVIAILFVFALWIISSLT